MFSVLRLIILACSLVIALSGSAFAQQTVNLVFDFSRGTEGWLADFSDYPPATNKDNFYELQAGLRTLPAEIDASRTGFYFQGSNHSGDLFSFMKRRLSAADGIAPRTRYQITFTLTFASKTQTGCVGIGGAPGESVYLKAGASSIEPLPLPNSQGWLVMNVDKGNQSQGGPAASVAGNIANGLPCNLSYQPYVTVRRTHQHTFEVASNSNGELWLLVGTDSGFEGRTTYYYQRVEVKLTPVGTVAEAAPTLFTDANTAGTLALDSATFMRDPLPPVSAQLFSDDKRTRVILFARDLELLPGEDASAVTVLAEDSQHKIYPLAVEFVGKVPKFDWLTQVNVRLPDELYKSGGVWITVKVHGLASNKAFLSLKP
ncbi:MAG: hypothetical protein ICV60_02145 [Pyrinomonadaceae bacterium]|nr:hypothetical protein [Pyrinomonadaceae bacterium]